MPYSRTRTYGREKKRRSSRIRKLLYLNAVLLAMATAAVIWLVSASPAGRESERALPSSGAETPPAAGASASSPASSAGYSANADPAGTSGGSGGETPGPGGAGEGAVTMAFVGDILPCDGVARLMGKFGYDYPFREASSLLRAADIAAGNLECPITTRGTPAQNKKYLFRGPAEALPAIKDAGFDVLTLANNHTMDFGWEGLQDTMNALDEHQLRRAGAGSDDREAFAPVYVESKGMKVAFIGVTRVVPEVSWKADRNHPGLAETYDPARAERAIREAKSSADLVVVMVHWGIERADKPADYQTVLGHRFIDAGADLVVGSHPHVLQGFESYNGKWIAYSLGNFVFNATATPKTAETGVLTAVCAKSGGCELALHPMLARNSQPAPMDMEAGRALLARLSAVSTDAVFEENGNLVAKR